MAKKVVIDREITDLDVAWSGIDPATGNPYGYDKSRVEAFIKKEFRGRVGYLVVDAGILYGFANEEDYQLWVEEPDDSLVVCRATLPAGGDTASDALAIYSIDSTQYYTKGEETVELKFKVRNVVDGTESADIAVTLLNSQDSSVAYVRQPVADLDGYYTLQVSGSVLKNIANTGERMTLKVERTGEDRSVSRTLTMFCIELGLELYSGFNFAISNPQSISYVPAFVLPSGMSSIKLVVEIYPLYSEQPFQRVETSSITTNNRCSVPLDWSALPYSGVYTAKAHLDMGGGLIVSDVVETNLICVTSSDASTVSLVAIEPIEKVTLYDDISPRIAVYHKGEEYATVKISLNGGTERTVSVPCNFVFSDYVLPIEQTDNTLSVQALDSQGTTIASATETFTAEGSFNWEMISGYVHHLVGKGRSNSELPTPANWGGITDFTGFVWNEYGSCWKDSALHLTSGSSAVIKMSPFYSTTVYNETRRIGGGILDTGRTFRIRFRTGNVSDTSKRVISCFDDDNQVGFYCTADTIYVKMGANGEITTDPTTGPQASQNNRRFSADTDVELGITVQPYWDSSFNVTKHFVTMYVNGEFAGDAVLRETFLSQSSALPVSLVADGCELDVQMVTYYDRCLDSFEMLQNYVMGLGSLTAMRDAFEKNQCYVGNGTVNFNETFRYCLALSAKIGDKVEGTCNIIVNTHTFDPSIQSTDVYPSGQQELELFFFRNGAVDTARSVKYVGENDKDLRVRIQGTSTASEYRKNMRYDSKGTVKVYRWSQELYEAGGSQNPSDGWYYVESTTKLAIYLRGDSSTENACKLLTVKTNYNESTATRNLPMARWVDDAIRYLSTQRDGNGNLLYPDLLTPPQRSDTKVRQAIDGLPAVQFTHDVGSQNYVFSGKVDLITDKKNSSVFGFQENEGSAHPDYSIEFRNGNTDICNFRCPYLVTAGKYLDSTFSTDGQDCLEYRWPDLDTGDVYYGDAFLRSGSAMQRLFDFVFNCHPDFVGFKSKNGAISATNGNITIRMGPGNVVTVSDTAEYRKMKFYNEMSFYMVKSSITLNGFVTKVLLWTDQRAKNQFFTHYSGDEVVADFSDDMNVAGQTYEILRLLPYDIDTSLRGDNASRLRYDFTRLYDDKDVFNDGVGVTTVSQAFYPTQRAISDATAFIANRVMGKRSALFELLDATCAKEYAAFYSLLSSGFLNEDALRKYCITEEADAFNAVIYNADTDYKYVASGSVTDQAKAHGSAKEDLMWWVKGRMYFMGGENGAGDFTNTSFYATMAMDSVLDATNLAMRFPSGSSGITLSIKSRCRNYIGTKLGSTGSLERFYCDEPTEYYNTTLVASSISNEDSGRFRIYGQQFFDDIADLSKLYISFVSDWGGCTSLKTMKFGSATAGFCNPALTNIKGSGNLTFGACELLDLRNCTAYADSDFRCFPALQTLYLTGCNSLTELRLPVTDNLVTLALPKNLPVLELSGKSKLTTLTVETGNVLSAITCSELGDTAVSAVLSYLNNYYS